MNLIDLYLYACGKSEVPEDLHKWAFISLMAACVRDQIWLMKGDRLFPNLYVMLICSSGVGKGTAINKVHKLALTPGLEAINLHRIKLTQASLVDLMSIKATTAAGAGANGNSSSNGKPKLPAGAVASKVYILTPELGNSVGSGQQAKDLIKMTTDLYDAQEFNPEEYTRTSGFHVIKRPVLNWLGGTTRQWLMESLDSADIFSGAFARIVGVQVNFDPTVRYPKPIYPPDRDEVLSYIAARLLGISKLRGEFKLTREAKEEEEEWIMSREMPPEDDPGFAVARREHDQILKVIQVISLAHEKHWHKLRGTVEDWREAKALIEAVNSRVRDLFNYAVETPQSQVVERGRNILRTQGYISHAMFLRRLRVRSDEFIHVVKTLEETEEIRVSVKKNVTYYTWHEHGLDFRKGE